MSEKITTPEEEKGIYTRRINQMEMQAEEIAFYIENHPDDPKIFLRKQRLEYLLKNIVDAEELLILEILLR